MRLHRFLINQELASPLIISEVELINQLRNVFRFKNGDRVILTDGKGKETEAVIKELNKKNVIFNFDQAVSINRGPDKVVTLYLALLKRENFELAVQKATEIGVAAIVPLITTRTVKLGFNRERILKIIKEAVEQSGRTVVPELRDPVTLQEAFTGSTGTKILFDDSGRTLDTIPNVTSCFIGPEGGWTDEEIAEAKKEKILMVSLGNITLRAETAAIVASYFLTH